MKTANIRLYLTIFLFIIFTSSVTRAQFDPVGTIERKVEEKVEQKTDEAIDKALEDPKPADEKKKDEKKETTTDRSSTTAPSTAVAPEFKTYSKYDFIPGEKVIYFE